MLSRRTFLKATATVPLMGCLGCASGHLGATPQEAEFLQVGFEGFAAALAYARCRAGAGCRVTLKVREGRLLGTWGDDDHVRIVRTGAFRDGGWHLDTRGICQEFMLRMEVMGPIASTPHPRPGRVWEPILRVGDVRRLMARMLEESGVFVTFGSLAARDFASERSVSGTEFVQGQRLGTARALADRQGVAIETVLGSAVFRNRLARDFAISG